MTEDTKTPETLPEEIKELELMLEEKKRALAERGEEREHKEIFREAFKEKFGPAPRVLPTPIAPSEPSATPKGKGDDTAFYAREEEMQSLVQLSFAKGVRQAIEAARRESPWLLDELHDRLIDEYYQKLVQAHQIQEPS